MASTINTNVSSLTAQRNLGMSQTSLNTSIQRLSSGLHQQRQGRRGHFAIPERFTSQIRGLNQAARNANDGISPPRSQKEPCPLLATSFNAFANWRCSRPTPATAPATGRHCSKRSANWWPNSTASPKPPSSMGRSSWTALFGTQQFQVGANANQTIIAATANLRTSVYGNNQNLSANGAGPAAQRWLWPLRLRMASQPRILFSMDPSIRHRGCGTG